MASLIGKKISHYRILRKIGEGGMGVVYQARDTRLEREVALKVLASGMLEGHDSRQRFRREALALSHLNHPNIATVYDFDADQDVDFLSMEMIHGSTLGEKLDRGPVAGVQALAIGAQIAEALAFAHAKGVIHRDLKPGNIMITANGLVKVLDFGLARRGRARRSRPKTATAKPPTRARTPRLPGVSQAMGTPGYMSPEQVRGLTQDSRTDAFAFGCVLFECLSGVRAFEGKTAEVVIAAVLRDEPRWSALPRGIPPRVRQLLAQCLEKDPEQRLSSIDTARAELEAILGGRRALAIRRTTTLASSPHNLPHPGTSFIGREAEIATCRHLLAESRLLTLTGSAGCGKTRLALEVAESAMVDYPDGVWFVDLAPLRDGTRVAQALASAVGVREEAETPLVETLQRALGEKRLLIVLDNCEHQRTPCAEIAQAMLRSGPNLTILTTSREGLRVAGEHVFSVPPLRTPSADDAATVVSLTAIESVRLFAERAEQAKPGFTLTSKHLGAVAEICRRLDGIPLAIELAASRLTVLSPEEIRSKLDQRFRLLTSEGHGTERHQTLRAAIQWSHEQLTREEQELFATLSVFAGGWTFESAAAVCGSGQDEFQVLDRFTHLVDKSLVVTETSDDGPSRYRYLETIHEFALECLEEIGEAARVRERHFDRVLSLAEEAAPQLTGPQQSSWLKRLDAEHENVLAAIRFGESGVVPAQKVLRLTAAIWRFWVARGLFRIGLRTLDRVLRLDGAREASPARAETLTGGGALAFHANDWQAGPAYCDESLAIFSEMGNARGMAEALVARGNLALGQGDYASARSFYDRALTRYGEAGQRRGMGVALSNSGRAAELQGDLEAAARLYGEGLDVLREVGDLSSTALRLSSLGQLSLKLGNYVAARQQLMECVLLVGELKEKRAGHFALERSAALLERLDAPREATVLVAAAEVLSEQAGSALTPRERSERDDLVGRLRERLGPDFEKASAEGRTLVFESALQRAHRSLSRARPGGGKTGDADTPAVAAGGDLDSTADLLAGIRSGDEAATARLVKRYLPILRRWAHGRLPGKARDMSDTDDLVQVALMRGLGQVESFDHRRTGAFLAYMRQIVRNQIRDEIRRPARRAKRVELRDDLPDRAVSPLEEAIGKQSLERYESALMLLPKKQRESVVMRLEMGFSYREIAEALDIPSEEAARVSIRRALQRLKKKMPDPENSSR